VSEENVPLYFLEWQTKDKFEGTIVRSFAVEDSLPEGSCNWFSSSTRWHDMGSYANGLIRYDGKTWKKVSIKSWSNRDMQRCTLIDVDISGW
jgi:hypothetical protein